MSDRITSLADYQRIRDSFRWPLVDQFNFGADIIDDWGTRTPDQLALRVDDGHNSQTRTFSQLSRVSHQIGANLQVLGLKPGDKVVIVLPRVVEWWEVLAGALKAGLVASPGTTLLTPKDLAYRLRASEAVALITDAAGAAKFAGLDEVRALRVRVLVADESRPNWTPYRDLLNDLPAEWRPASTRGSDPALIYFTSGTTGFPKMVLHTQASYGLGHQVTGRYWLDLRPGDLHWNISDTGWAKAAWSSFFAPWICGAGVYAWHPPGKFDAADVLRLLANEPITTLCAAPTIYRLLVQLDLAGFQSRSLRHCVAAGEPLNPEVISVWERATGLLIRDGYGQTESVLLCGNFPGLEVRPGSMGRPSPGFDLDVIDETGQRLPCDQEGDIAIRLEPERPLGMFQEYWRDPAAMAQSFVNGWYRTGDRARRDADGYFWFVGRADDVITSSAYRIGPFEVESALIEHPAVAEAAVVGSPDAVRGEVVKAFVVLARGFEGSASLATELQEHVKRVTAPYKYPREIEFVSDLPKTSSGKIRRVELRDRERVRKAPQP